MIEFGLIEAMDYAILKTVQSIASKPLDLVFSIITFFGNPAAWIILAAVIYWNGKERDSFFLMNLIVFSAAIVAFAKNFFAKPRPSSSQFRIVEPLFPKLEYSEMLAFSFPSGHASIISSIFFYFKKISKKTRILLALMVLLVAVSRIYLGMHFFTDVLGGILVGFFVATANNFLKKTVEKKELKLTKFEGEFGFVAALALAFTAIIFFKTPNLALVVLGYYAGFFLLKEINFEQKEIEKEKFWLKTGIGLFGIGIIGLSLQFIEFGKTIELTAYFLIGLWISFIWPILWEKAPKWAKVENIKVLPLNKLS